jgi:hypothetical protein
MRKYERWLQDVVDAAEEVMKQLGMNWGQIFCFADDYPVHLAINRAGSD